MQYPNRLHFDEDFAAESEFGRIIAPQSFAVCTIAGHGATPANSGRSRAFTCSSAATSGGSSVPASSPAT